MRSVLRFGPLLLLAAAGPAACTSILGGFDFNGPAGSGGTGGSTSGTGGVASSSSSSSSTTSSSTSGSSTGGGGAGGCSPGTTQSCYDGPAGTEGVGICKAGMQTCDGSGVWGACTGATKPAIEDCAVPQDEDCDGYACSETVWAALYGDDAGQTLRATASDAMGNIVLTGQLDGSITFGATTLVASGPQDIYLAKLDKDGNAIWAKQYGSPAGQRIPYGVRIDSTGAIVLAGYFSDTMVFGGTTLTATDRDVFVAKLDPDGNPIWAKQFGSAMGDQQAYGLAVDAAGDIALAGYFWDKLDFGCGALDSSSFVTGFVAKLDPDGNCIFSTQAASWGQMNAVSFDASGNVVAVGEASNGMNFDWLAVRYDSLGNLAWSQQFGSDNGDDRAKGVAVDSTGNIYVTGHFESTMFFPADPAKNLISAGASDVALVKLKASTGAPLWSKRFGDAAAQNGYGVAVDKHDGIVITGLFYGSIGFGGPTHTEMFGQYDAFLAKFKTDGTFVWSRSFGGSSGDFIQSVSISKDDTILFGEATSGPTIDLGTGTLTVAGSSDAALAKVAP